MEIDHSFVKLRIAEKEERIQREKDRKTTKPNRMSSQQKDGKYFLIRLDMEIQRINGLIDVAERDSRLSQLTEEVSGRIRTAIGKAQLLLSKRFKQFKELCNDNIENDPDKKETKSSDLQGYWDMMFIQVEDVNSLFTDIQKLKENNWEIAESEAPDGALKPSTGTTEGSTTPKNKRKSTNGKSPRSKNNNVDDEKVKREARSRLAAARKQAKLRAQQDAANGSLNSSLNNSWTVETNENENSFNEQLNDSCNGDVSLNSSLNTDTSLTSSNSSSTEILSNGTTSNVEIIPPVAIEVNSVA